MRPGAAVIALVVAVCGSCGPKEAPAPSKPPTTTLADLAWLEGEWEYESYAAVEYWVPHGGVLWGFVLSASTWEMNIVDVGRDGVVQLWPSAGNVRAHLVYAISRRGDRWATFANSRVIDDPSAYTYERVTEAQGERLILTRHTLTGAKNVTMRRAPACEPVPELVAFEEKRGYAAVWTCRGRHGDKDYAASVATRGTSTHATLWMQRGDSWELLLEDRRP